MRGLETPLYARPGSRCELPGSSRLLDSRVDTGRTAPDTAPTVTPTVDPLPCAYVEGDDMIIIATLPAADLDRAKAWYSKIFGIEPVGAGAMGGLWYEIDGSRFLLYPSEHAGTNQATAAGMQVEDVEATVAELRARGASFEEYDFGDGLRTVDGIITLPTGQKAAWLKDSEGNILGIAPADL